MKPDPKNSLIKFTDQIAAEAAECIDSEQQTGQLGVPSLKKIIKSACEKAVEDVAARWTELYSQLHETYVKNLTEERAAHPPSSDYGVAGASEPRKEASPPRGEQGAAIRELAVRIWGNQFLRSGISEIEDAIHKILSQRPTSATASEDCTCDIDSWCKVHGGRKPDDIIAPTKDFMESLCKSDASKAGKEWTVEGEPVFGYWVSCNGVRVGNYIFEKHSEAQAFVDAHNSTLPKPTGKEWTVKHGVTWGFYLDCNGEHIGNYLSMVEAKKIADAHNATLRQIKASASYQKLGELVQKIGRLKQAKSQDTNRLIYKANDLMREAWDLYIDKNNVPEEYAKAYSELLFELDRAAMSREGKETR